MGFSGLLAESGKGGDKMLRSVFCCIKKYRYRLHFDTKFLISLTLFESLKVVLINMVAILTMSANLATLDLSKVNDFEIKFLTL